MFSEHTLKLSCTMCFNFLKKFMRALFFPIKCPYACKFKVIKIRKILSFFYIRTLYQLLHSQVYCNDLKLWTSNFKFVLIIKDSQTESCEKVCLQKLTNDTKKASSDQRKAWHHGLNIDTCAIIKHKIILSWP